MKKERIIFLYIFLALLFFALTTRIAYLQFIKGNYYNSAGYENTIRNIPINPARGDIYSSDGVILAKSAFYFKLSLLSFEVKNPSAVLSALAKIVPLTEIEKKFIIQSLKKNTLAPVLVKDMIDYETFCRLAEIKSDYSGIYLEAQPIRDYPLGSSTCHLLGYDGLITEEELKNQSFYSMGDNIGKDGIEKEYDSSLRGVKGADRIQVDVSGKLSSVVDTIFPKRGDNLVLTIDYNLQKTTEKALNKAVSEIEATNGEKSGGAVIVLNANSGEILAMASYPQYDPNLFAKGISQKDYDTIIRNKATPLLNRVIHGAYPCASTFKLITAASSLDYGIVAPDDYFYCQGSYNLDGHIFNCFVTSGHGSVSFRESMAYSCDVVYYMLAVKFPIDIFLKYISDFGLGKKTGIDLPGENPGLLPSPQWKKNVYKEDWFPGDTVNLSIGQGFVEVTPIQVALFTSAVANGGTIYKPYLLKRSISAEGKMINTEKTEILNKVNIDERYFKVVREGMRGAVEYGTAGAADSNFVKVAGKTGTAENFPTEYNPYGRNHTWFTSFAPYENPEIVVTVFLEKSGGFGGEKSAKVARAIYDEKYKITEKIKQAVR